MMYKIIAGFLILSLFLHSALEAKTNITMIYRQLGWIAVILLLLTGEVCENFKKIIDILNENKKVIDKPIYTQTETQEDVKQKKEDTESVQKVYIIILVVLVIIALSVLCFAFINKSDEDVKPINNTYHTNIDNSHTPATQMYK